MTASSATSMPREGAGAHADAAPARRSPMAGKRVRFLINCNEGGGVEYLAGVLSADLSRQGALTQTRYMYPASAAKPATKIVRILATVRELWRDTPDVLISFQPTSSVLAGVVGRLAGCRIRIVHQSNLPFQSNGAVRVLDRVVGALGFYSVNIANSYATEQSFSAYPAPYRRYMRRIDHGIATPVAKRDRRTVLAAFGIPDSGKLLLAAARLDVQKGQDVIISAMPRIPQARFIAAGQGPGRDRFEALAKDLGVADRVHFLGHIPRQDLLDLYKACDLLVFPSVWETFGLAAVEAAMMGLPVVSSDLPVMREVLSVEGTPVASFVASRKPADWANQIAQALADPDLAARSKQYASLLQEKYSEERMLAAYADLYTELCA